MERKEKSQAQSATAEPQEALLQAALARWQHAVDQDMPIVGAAAVEWLSEFIGEARRLLLHPPYALENHQTGEITRHEKFSLGQIIATPDALEALKRAGQSPLDFLARHVSADWGEVCEKDRRENEFALQHGFRLLSVYTTKAGEKLWVISEADRSATTVLLPADY